MADFDLESAQAFQQRIIERIRAMERMLDNEVIAYYKADSVDDEEDARENLRGMHNYIKRAYKDLDQLLTEIEHRPEFH